jgi:AcrR family transcriptional regulator
MRFRQSTAVADTEERPDTRALIVESAERVFRTYGYAKTTVADIAREMGMSPANIYRFFPSKAALHEAIADRIVGEVEAGGMQIARLPLSASERLRLLVVERYKQTVAIMLDQHKVHEMVAIALDEQWPVVERHLDRIASGEFVAADPAAAARCFFAAMASTCHPALVAQCMNKPNRASPEELVDFALKALRP